MQRAKKTFSFWQKQTASLEAMMLRSDAPTLDGDERKEIISHFPALQGKRILELGAGIGRFTSFFAKAARHITAVDFIPRFIEMNQKKHGTSVEYLCADVMELELKTAQFDFIFMNHLLMYLDDSEVQILATRCVNWLDKGGHLFFRESCSASGKHFKDDYYVYYRSLFFYTELFNQRLKLIEQDNLKLFELRFANPFQCFWLFQK
jgi:phosphoethanolamine N-methyltransferase